MKLLLRRDQQTGGLMGNTTFSLTVRADLSDEERTNISKYKLGKCLLYSRGEIVDPGSGLLGLASRVAFKMMNISITVDDLTQGKRVDCKDIVEMLAVEEQIKDAARNFRAVLEAASTFGGEHLVEL
ncbi:hypothetical protein [Parvibaculum sp.]|uniref:hypothetical protein n=1 Tax=Parvibaculum sp. TaxID=2024848 RepID=UPI00262B051D|nr:hypothetical protein [Parvibaculum sp.]MCW5726216.1 hypothetical protein [Parvibaculum sp.]